MLDLARIAGFNWDQGNVRKSIDKHGVSQLEAEQIFVDSKLLILADEMHSSEEKRFQAYGETVEGRKLQVSFTLRHDEGLIRVGTVLSPVQARMRMEDPSSRPTRALVRREYRVTLHVSDAPRSRRLHGARVSG